MEAVKAHLKNLAQIIRSSKVEMKKLQRLTGHSNTKLLFQARQEFRKYHIALCELRGRSIEEIESNPKLHVHSSYIQQIKDRIIHENCSEDFGNINS